MVSILKYKNKSYLKDYSSHYKVNGKPLEQPQKNSTWYLIDGDVTSITSEKRTGGDLIGWKLRDEYSDYESDKFPKEFPSSEFSRWADDDDDPRRVFYEAVLNEYKTFEDTVEYTVFNVDSEPRQLPYWCDVKFPACVEEFPELQHNFPCSISYQTLFSMVWNRVKEIVGKSENLSMDDYHNIQTLKVQRKILIPKNLQKSEQQGYYKNSNSRKMSYRTITKTEKWVDVLKLKGKYDGSSDHDRTPTLEGKNLSDLEKKIEEYIQSILSLLDPSTMIICPTCLGHSIVKSDCEEKCTK